MSPAVFNEEEYEKSRDSMAVGNLLFGGLNFTWDLRDILAETRKRERIERANEYFISNGRILMPKYGIL